MRQIECGTVEFMETAVRSSEGEYWTVVHGYTTTARPLLSTLPDLQGLGWENLCCGIVCASSAYIDSSRKV